MSSGAVHKVLHGDQYPPGSNNIAFDPTSTRFATTRDGRTVSIRDVQTRELLLVLVHSSPEAHASLSPDESFRPDVSFSPDGRLVLSASRDYSVKVWDASTGIMVLSLVGHSGSVNAACFSPCGAYIASASDDGTVRFWRTRDGTCMTTLSDHKAQVQHVVFSPDGKTVTSGAMDGTVFIRRMAEIIPNESLGL